MMPCDLLRQATADGLAITLTAAGRLRLTGDPLAVNRWLPIIGHQYHAEVIAELSTAANCAPLMQVAQ